MEKFSLYVEKDSRTSRCAACHHPRTRHRRCPLEAWNLYLLELDRTELPCAGNEEFPVRECLPIPVPVGRKILRPRPHKLNSNGDNILLIPISVGIFRPCLILLIVITTSSQIKIRRHDLSVATSNYNILWLVSGRIGHMDGNVKYNV